MKYLTTIFLFSTIGYHQFLNAQTCPPNIDFESGDFRNWTTGTGNYLDFDGDGVYNSIIRYHNVPVWNRHTMYSRFNDIQKLDTFGRFPVVCPNGSGYSVRIGNDEVPQIGNGTGGEIDEIKYTFTVPSSSQQILFTYWFAVVFRDPQYGTVKNEPSFYVTVKDVAKNEIAECLSTKYQYGFNLDSAERIVRNREVIIYQNWTEAVINLTKFKGRKIELTFTATDNHIGDNFGYAYLDINSGCDNPFSSAPFCKADSATYVHGPGGYAKYEWYNQSLTNLSGTEQRLFLSPIPPDGTVMAMIGTYYTGTRCKDTLYYTLRDTLNAVADAGYDSIYCKGYPLKLGGIPKPGLQYIWSPGIGLSNDTIANPFANPQQTTNYTLIVKSAGGGCRDTASIRVRPSQVNNTLLSLEGKKDLCFGTSDFAKLTVKPEHHILWIRDAKTYNSGTDTSITVFDRGNYYALLTNADGCQARTNPHIIQLIKPPKGITYDEKLFSSHSDFPLIARNIGVKASWSPAVFLSSPSIYKPVFNGAHDVKYLIQFEDIYGCKTVDTQYVKVFNKEEIFVPTAFTPNNDGLNDVLKPYAVNIKEMIYFRIYNRYGKMVFESLQPEKGWNGTYKGVTQDSGNFIWVYEGVHYKGHRVQAKGTVLLLR
ncbi:T9SS type B sorting domain-containing protein [Lacibacter sp.]|uniref:T9SS type B sorting domain-containing protein n=1 Tax=Lacibacter sp. TaxID=1915409 RepID=UPI002B4AEBAF|nr:T9SS type B sorting domain-containing protein [Lacibacter sp.]HLP37634.1 T9SS type B sorting domain-containing protein [Lacibacter sp.]